MAKKQQGTTAWQKRMSKGVDKSVDLYGVFSVETDRRVYPGEGLPIAEAQRLADGLLQPAEVRLVKSADEAPQRSDG